MSYPKFGKVRPNRRRRNAPPRPESLERRELLTTVLLNELASYPYPYNYPNQFVEIETVNSSGTPVSASLSGYQFVRFDGYEGHTGIDGSPDATARLVINLSSYSTGSNGLLLLEADPTQTGASIASGALLSLITTTTATVYVSYVGNVFPFKTSNQLKTDGYGGTAAVPVPNLGGLPVVSSYTSS